MLFLVDKGNRIPYTVITVKDKPTRRTTMKNGSQVKFKEIIEAGDELATFEVIECRGPRMLVAPITFIGTIRPTFCYMTEELVCV